MNCDDMIACVVTEALAFAANASGEVQTQVTRLLSVLQKPVIDLLQLRVRVLSDGGLPAPYAPALRSLVWRLLLGLLPPVRSEWMSHLSAKRAVFEQYVIELVHEPELITYLRHGVSPRNHSPAFKGAVPRRSTGDHPLALPDSPSRWRRYWSDQEIYDAVNKDVFRTRPEMNFFSQETTELRINNVTVRADTAELSKGSPKAHAFACANIVSPKSHYDRICRILFLYAKLNFGYVQGMNEIVAPLYFTLFSDPLEGHFVEADCFFALTAVMQEQRDVFCQNLDDSSLGMRGRLHAIEKLLTRIDPLVAVHLKEIGVKMNFFALRWILLLFAQDFEITSVQVIWDALFADHTALSHKDSMLVNFVCVAMIEKVREAVLAGDFTDVMRVLQRYPPFEAREIVNRAMQIRSEDDDLVHHTVLDSPEKSHSPRSPNRYSFTTKLTRLLSRKKRHK